MIQIDIDMPNCCDDCFALDDHGDYPYCRISQDQRGYTFNTREKRMPTCPLKGDEKKDIPELREDGYPCKDCEVRKAYAKAFDIHMSGEDCMYECEIYDKWKKESRLKQASE